jgi:hypothetical protein
MMPITYPQVTNVEVVATQSQPADSEKIAHLRSTTNNTALADVTYVVKVDLREPMPATSMGYTLLVGDYPINKYASFTGGIYFKVYDPNFFAEHGGESIKFSVGGMAAHETGARLPIQPTAAATLRTTESSELPTQEQILRPEN